MRTAAQKPATTLIPVQLSATKFAACIFPDLRCPSEVQSANWAIIASLTLSCGCPTQGCSGSACLCRKMPRANRPYTIPLSTESSRNGPMMGRLWQAFIASVAHLSTEKHLDIRVLHGDGTNTVAKKGAMALATQATSTRSGRRLWRSRTTMALWWLPSPRLL